MDRTRAAKESTSQSGSTCNPYRYVGSLGCYSADTTTSLLHLGTRYYSPQVGRFWTEDPGRDGLNSYVYVADNPVNRTDPAGLMLGDPAMRCKIRAFGRFVKKVVPVFALCEFGCMVVCGALNWWNAEIAFPPCLEVCQIAALSATGIQAIAAYGQFKKELKDCEKRCPPATYE